MTAVYEAQQQIQRIKPSFGYYRQPDGSITASPAAELDELKYRRKGWTPLTQYGRVEMTTPYAADHPLEALFMQGGARELSVKQIIDQGFHLDPPLVPGCNIPLSQNHPRHNANCMANAYRVVFPQMEGVEAAGHGCRFCDRVLPTEQARNQHEGVAHKEEKSEIRSGETLAASMIKGIAAMQTRPAALPYACGICGESFNSPAKLGQHVKAEHKTQEDNDGEG